MSGTEIVIQAAEVLARGGVVAFPTETVYGLGADATSPAAVQRVFDLKGRPHTNPVIVHVADDDMARCYAAAWPVTATRLVEQFWPGPLTIVLPRTEAIAPIVTAGRHTVGLRSPDHPLTLELLRRFGRPLIGPSANRSTRISPTTAQHVRDDFGDAIDLVLDGGPCRFGIESTVLDLSGSRPIILRPGAISREQIEQAIGSVDLFGGSVIPTMPAASPGQHPVHYAPISPTYRFERGEAERLSQWLAEHPRRPAIILRMGDAGASAPPAPHREVLLPDRPEEYARRMYAALRHADRQSPAAIWIELPPDEPRWLAVRDRLLRASRPAPVHLPDVD